MKQFKKKALVLVLASVVTVVGAFGAENYKNSLMSIETKSGADNTVNLKLLTKRDYTKPITISRKDANTYVIILSETDGRNAKTPEIKGNIESINVNTMPYTTNGQGYTKITVKTVTQNTLLTTEKALYIEDKNQNTPQYNEQRDIPEKERRQEEEIKPARNETYTPPVHKPEPIITESTKQFEPPKVQEPEPERVEPISENNIQNTPTNIPQEKEDYTLLLLGLVAVIFICAFLYIHGKNKMSEIVGEHEDFSFEEEQEKKNGKKDIRKTINKLDEMYTKPAKMPVKITPTEDMPAFDSAPIELTTPEDDLIVDLDELFQGQTLEDESNSALDDFLNDFNFDEETELVKEEEQEQDSKIEELFEKYIKNGVISFSKIDVDKINELLNSEINDETIKNISQYAVSNPIEPKKPTRAERLENFITAYTINQNISFTKDDVDALNKLVNVEIDSDFVKDLTTNPERAKEMQKEIESRQVSHKNHEMLTLNVKDMLPDLSEALKKQGNKRIESEVKPQVVYYSEGYDVSKLSVSEDLPNLVLDFDNPEYNQYRPSDEVEIAAEGYDVQTLSIKDELPNLDDVMANPDKYNEKKEKAKVDEDTLLKNLSNVTFKPFYDGYESFEIADKFGSEASDNEPAESLEQEKITEEKIIDSEESQELEQPVEQEEEILPILERTVEHHRNNKPDENAEKLMDLIHAQQDERKQKENETLNKVIQEKQQKEKRITIPHKPQKQFCTVDGIKYEIINDSPITDSIGCYLAKNEEGYTILGYIGEKIIKIKYYETLKSQKLQSRVNEKLENGKVQYLVRIGLHKFVLNVSEDNMEYVMDLC